MKVDLLATQGKFLETQVAQQASSSSRQQGQLPPKSDCNPNASVKAITLRSETAYDGPEMPPDAEVHVHQKQPDLMRWSKRLTRETLMRQCRIR
jgi:hypothetical protein